MSPVRWYTDCECHVSGIQKVRARAPDLLPLHDFLDQFMYRNSTPVLPEHIPGVQNDIADALSRGSVSEAIELGLRPAVLHPDQFDSMILSYVLICA